MQVCFLGLRVFSSLCQSAHFVSILRRRDFPLASFAFFGLGDTKDDHIPEPLRFMGGRVCVITCQQFPKQGFNAFKITDGFCRVQAGPQGKVWDGPP